MKVQQIQVGHHKIFNGNDDEIIGHHLKVLGNGNIVAGHHNTVMGNGNTIKGNHNTIMGDSNTIKGHHNIITGDTNIVMGKKNTISGIGNRENHRLVINDNTNNNNEHTGRIINVTTPGSIGKMVNYGERDVTIYNHGEGAAYVENAVTYDKHHREADWSGRKIANQTFGHIEEQNNYGSNIVMDFSGKGVGMNIQGVSNVHNAFNGV